MAIKNVSAAKNSPECVCGRDSAPHPSGELTTLPQTSYSAGEGMPPPHYPLPDAFSVPGRRLRSLPRY